MSEPDEYKRDPAYGKKPKWNSLYKKHFPQDTDGCSRHVRLISDEILRKTKSRVRRLLIDAGYEPDHWAESMELTVVDLWDQRAKLKAICPHEHWEPAYVDEMQQCAYCGQLRDTQ